MNTSGPVEGKFKTRKSLGKSIYFFLAFGIFIPIGVILYFLSDQTIGMVMFLFGFIPLLYFLFRIISPGAYYQVGYEGLILKKGVSAREIEYSAIGAAAVIDEEESKRILNEYLEGAVEGERNRDIKAWYQSNKKYGNFIRFCSVPIIQSTTSKGTSRNITSFNNLAKGSFVLLQLTSGEEFLLSPEENEGFVQKLQSTAAVSDSIDPGFPGRGTDIDMQSPQAVKKRNRFQLINIIVFIVICAIAIPLALTRNRATEDSIELGWVDENTYRVEVVRPIDKPEIEEIEERKMALRWLVAEAYSFQAAGEIIFEYQTAAGKELSEGTLEAMHKVLDPFIMSLDVTHLVQEFDKDVSRIRVVFEVSEDGFHNMTNSLIMDVLEAQGE
jgi:hypothetical protein